MIDRTELKNQGYVTDELDGVWTRAPYLHNGSVPTLYHLLVPTERPTRFVRGSISYDQKQVGWRWDIAAVDEYRKADPTVAVFDTTLDSASNRGHDTNLTVDIEGNIVRMDWSGPNRAGEKKVRMDWSGPENEDALYDLLEYLKTL